jgi:hypothetical protein
MPAPRPRPESVVIDGVRYVPVAIASPHADAILDAIVSQWAGDNWRTDYPGIADRLRVVVSDTTEDDEGETVTDFLARLLLALNPEPSPGEG